MFRNNSQHGQKLRNPAEKVILVWTMQPNFITLVLLVNNLKLPERNLDFMDVCRCLLVIIHMIIAHLQCECYYRYYYYTATNISDLSEANSSYDNSSLILIPQWHLLSTQWHISHTQETPLCEQVCISYLHMHAQCIHICLCQQCMQSLQRKWNHIG